LIASGLAVLLARLIMRLLVRLAPAGLPQLREVSIDLRVAGFALVLGVVTSLLFGLLPALQVTRERLAQYLRGAARGRMEAARPQRRSQSVFVVTEVAVAFALLSASTLLLGSLLRLQSVDPGFKPTGVLGAEIGLSGPKYVTPSETWSFYGVLLQRLRGLPGVRAAGAVDALPMTGSSEGTPYRAVGAPAKRHGDEPIVRVSVATPDYFRALGIAVLEGRGFTTTDGPDAHALVINQALARACWPGVSPIGKRLMLGHLEGPMSFVVVGLVADTRDDGLGEAAAPRVYASEQEFGAKAMTLVVKTSGDPRALIAAVRGEVRALDPEQPVYNILVADDLVATSLTRSRLVTYVVGCFSLLALMLAAVGVYGVMLSHLVQRTKEFGLRMALGSRMGEIVWIVMREGLLLVLIGIAAGCIAAVAGSRLISSFLFGIGHLESTPYGAAALVLIVVCMGGCAALLRRIRRLEPTTALRYD
jgi:putative ABC transport system permease protein